MRVAFRADASTELGTGHLMRCLVLADALSAAGAEICFICRDLPDALADLTRGKGYRVEMLGANSDSVTAASERIAQSGVPESSKLADAAATAFVMSRAEGWDWLVVDHYGIDSTWESELRKVAVRLFVIDDLCDRKHDCDMLLDQNCASSMTGAYDLLVPERARVLLGPKYALVAPDFSSLRPQALQRRTGALRQVLIFMGGTDSVGETTKALAGVQLARERGLEIGVVVVTGASNPSLSNLRARCGALPWAKLYVQTKEMARLMSEADLAVGAGGTSTWERCTLGLPSLTTLVAENQRPGSIWVAREGAQQVLGWWETLTPETYAKAIADLSGESLLAMSRRAFTVCDGAGAGLVAEEMLAFHD